MNLFPLKSALAIVLFASTCTSSLASEKRPLNEAGRPQAISQLRGSTAGQLNSGHWIIRAGSPTSLQEADRQYTEVECGAGLNCANATIAATAPLRMQLDNNVADILGLRHAINEAQLSNAGLRASIAETEAANARIWREIAQFTPIITGSLNANRYSSNYSTSNSSTSYADISASLPIFTSGRRYYGVKSARSSAIASLYNGIAARNDVTQQTISVYLNYFYARSSRALFARNLKDLKRLLYTVIKRRNAGFASTADIYQVKADIASLQQEVVNAGKIMAQSKAELNSLAGRPVSVPANLPKIGYLVAGSKTELISQALSNNPNILAASHLADAAEYTSKSTFGKYLPQVSLNGNYRRDFDPSSQSSANSWSIGIKLSVPLVDLATAAEISETQSMAQSAYYRSIDTRRRVELQTNTLWQEQTSNNQRVKLAKNKAHALRRVVRSKLAQFSKGLIAIDPVLEQKRLLALAEMAEIQARTEQFLSSSQLLITAGIFKTSMLDG